MGSRSSSIKPKEPSTKPPITCELDPDVVKNTHIWRGYYFDHKFYLLTDEYSPDAQVIIVNLFTGQHKSLPITNLPEDIHRPWLVRFMLLQRKLDGTLLGLVEVCSDSDIDETTYYYSVLLDQTECRVMELIQKFNENEITHTYSGLSFFDFRFVCHRSDIGSYTIYEVFVEHDKIAIREVSTFDHPDDLCEISTSGRYVTAYPEPLPKEKGSIYVRNLLTGKWNWLELPFPISHDCLSHHLDGHGDTAKYTCVVGLNNRGNIHINRVITLEMDTNELHVFADQKIEFYGTECHYFTAADDNTILSFNRTFEFGPDPKRPCTRLFYTGPFLVHRITIRRPEKLSVLTFLASRVFVASGQINLPKNYPIHVDGRLSKSAFDKISKPQNFPNPKFPQGTYFSPAI